MPPRDALAATGLYGVITIAIILIADGLVTARKHHVLNWVFGIAAYIIFIGFCLWVR
jgi:hypothetical protein